MSTLGVLWHFHCISDVCANNDSYVALSRCRVSFRQISLTNRKFGRFNREGHSWYCTKGLIKKRVSKGSFCSVAGRNLQVVMSPLPHDRLGGVFWEKRRKN